MALLELRNLKKYYAAHKAVDDVSFSIAQGCIFGLLGPNGAGKTTLLRMVTGILYPDEGEVILDGKKLDPEKDVQKIGYMPEERGLYKKMKIGEHALYLAQLKGLSRGDAMRKIKYWFDRLEMQSWWDKKVEDLSKGMGQKLQFVTTVLHDPRLIILDEPFSGLDPVNANLIKDEIFNLANNGSTVIFSTHRMEQVEEICNNIALINLGKKILDGGVSAIKQQFKEHLYELRIAASDRNILDDSFEIISMKENHLSIKIKEGFTGNDVLKSLIEKQIQIDHFSEVLPSLNDIFIRQVRDTDAVSRSFQND